LGKIKWFLGLSGDFKNIEEENNVRYFMLYMATHLNSSPQNPESTQNKKYQIVMSGQSLLNKKTMQT